MVFQTPVISFATEEHELVSIITFEQISDDIMGDSITQSKLIFDYQKDTCYLERSAYDSLASYPDNPIDYRIIEYEMNFENGRIILHNDNSSIIFSFYPDGSWDRRDIYPSGDLSIDEYRKENNLGITTEQNYCVYNGDEEIRSSDEKSEVEAIEFNGDGQIVSGIEYTNGEDLYFSIEYTDNGKESLLKFKPDDNSKIIVKRDENGRVLKRTLSKNNDKYIYETTFEYENNDSIQE